MPRKKTSSKLKQPPIWRQHFLFCGLLSAFLMLGMRVVQLQTVEYERLRAQGDARHLRELTVQPERGRILDRHGQVLAVSTPVDSLWAEPSVFCAAQTQWEPMLDLVKVSHDRLQVKCEKQKHSGFMYIKRRLRPKLTKQVMQLAIPGVQIQREYRRYYPGGPAGAHLLGFSNVDDVGQEGLESVYNSRLSGVPGKIRVLKDRQGNYVELVESIQQVRHGEELSISIDQRIQSLASEYLEAALKKYEASSGSVVVLGIPSGEILAMVNSPQFNPNDRSTITGGTFRNRSVTDVFEPGSTVKPFSVAMAIESGEMTADSIVDTAPGYYQIGDHTIKDLSNYGAISVSDVVIRSSNVGIAKIALSLPYDDLFNTLSQVGFGVRAIDLPGETPGMLKKRTHKIEHAALAYGYGFSVTPIQLARAYSVFATDGVLLPVTLERKPDGYRAKGVRVFNEDTVYTMRAMLEQAVSPRGTAAKARISRYRVGGKTGTSHKLLDGSYENERYLSAFAGIGPLTDPKFVIAVTVDDPRGKYYFGGDVAAPVFSKLMNDLMRLYNIEPDDLPHTTADAKTKTTANATAGDET